MDLPQRNALPNTGTSSTFTDVPSSGVDSVTTGIPQTGASSTFTDVPSSGVDSVTTGIPQTGASGTFTDVPSSGVDSVTTGIPQTGASSIFTDVPSSYMEDLTAEKPAGFCNIRFLQAAMGLPPIDIIAGDNLIQYVDYGEITPYFIEDAGVVTVSLRDASAPGDTLYTTQLQFQNGDFATIAILNGPGGVTLYTIDDSPCTHQKGTSCLRVVNLAYQSPYLNFIAQGYGLLFKNVGYLDTTPYRSMVNGSYTIAAYDSSKYYAQADNVFSAAFIGRPVPLFIQTVSLSGDMAYTLFVFGNPYGFPSVQALLAQSGIRVRE